MADGLSTKMLGIIANSSSRALSKPWIPLAIEQMRMFSKNKGIFLPEHILLCNLDIKNITATTLQIFFWFEPGFIPDLITPGSNHGQWIFHQWTSPCSLGVTWRVTHHFKARKVKTQKKWKKERKKCDAIVILTIKLFIVHGLNLG